MIKVDGPRGPSRVDSKRTEKARSSGPSAAFRSELGQVSEDGDGEAAAVEHGAGVAGVEGVFLAQTVGDRGGAGRPTRNVNAGPNVVMTFWTA